MRTALVTGGTRGIGKAIVSKLESQGVKVHAWNSKTLDITDESWVADEVEKIGQIDILVNNAGKFGKVGSALTYDLLEWDEVMRVNLTSQFVVSKCVIPAMVKRGYGRVVNMSSVAAKDVNPMAPAYSVSKAGIVAYTRLLGKELAKTGVVVNCVLPHAVNTDLFKDTPKEQVDIMLKKCPMERFVTVEEVANMVCWLASEECSATTGAAFDIAGGRCQF